MKTIVCADCGQAAERTGQRQFLCSGCASAREARRHIQARKTKPRRSKKRTPILSCAYCEAQFLRDSPGQKYCSEVCAVAGKRQRQALAAKQYRLTDESRRKAKERATVRNNTEERRTYIRVYLKKKRLTDRRYAISTRMKAMVGNVLAGKKNGKSWQKIVGYSVDELIAHLERQFLPRMGWHNRDKWHIDHITPVSHFSFSDYQDPEFKACWGLANLRPLWADENLRKSSKRISLL